MDDTKLDLVIIDDVDQQYRDALAQNRKLDISPQARQLSLIARGHGRRTKCLAIVSAHDESSQRAMAASGFELVKVNGNRPQEMGRLFGYLEDLLQTTAVNHTILASSDVGFQGVCRLAATRGSLSVWSLGEAVPVELAMAGVDARSLAEVIDPLGDNRYPVFLDYENLHIGLEQAGLPTEPRQVIAAVRALYARVGQVVSITAYADWGELSRNSGGVDLQRLLVMEGVSTVYQVGIPGKSSSDMVMVDDAYKLLDSQAAAGLDGFGLGTMDRDFRKLMETLKERGKKVALLGIKGQLKDYLREMADVVLYLDEILRPAAEPIPLPLAVEVCDEVVLMQRVVAFLSRKGWKYIYRDRLEQELPHNPRVLEAALAMGLLVLRPGDLAVLPNPEHPWVKLAMVMSIWLPHRVSYSLVEKHMPYVDKAYLVRGMLADEKLKAMGLVFFNEGERWLEIAARAGLVLAATQPHPINTAKQIVAYSVPD